MITKKTEHILAAIIFVVLIWLFCYLITHDKNSRLDEYLGKDEEWIVD